MIFSKHLQQIWAEWKFHLTFYFEIIRLFSFLDDITSYLYDFCAKVNTN